MANITIDTDWTEHTLDKARDNFHPVAFMMEPSSDGQVMEVTAVGPYALVVSFLVDELAGEGDIELAETIAEINLEDENLPAGV